MDDSEIAPPEAPLITALELVFEVLICMDSNGFDTIRAMAAAVISDAFDFALGENSADATNDLSTAVDGCGCSVVAPGE